MWPPNWRNEDHDFTTANRSGVRGVKSATGAPGRPARTEPRRPILLLLPRRRTASPGSGRQIPPYDPLSRRDVSPDLPEGGLPGPAVCGQYDTEDVHDAQRIVGGRRPPTLGLTRLHEADDGIPEGTDQPSVRTEESPG
jgi:hypothetical protein